MSNNTYNKELKENSLKLYSLKKSVKTIATVNFMNKVKLLCKSVRDVEWSGVLFYSTKNSIVNPDTLVITLEDILLMDIGTKSLTEYNFDDDETLAMDIVELLQKSEKHRKMKRGLIHSHNTMGVFFSQTDNDELVNGAITHNYYLSVIVNSFGDITGKISFVGETEVKKEITNRNEQGKIIKNKVGYFEKCVYTYDCLILDEHTLLKEDKKEFLDRITYIQKKVSEKKALELKKAAFNFQSQPVEFYKQNKKNEKLDAFKFFPTSFDQLEESKNVTQIVEQIEFASYCLNDGNVILDEHGKVDIDSIIEDIVITNVDSKNFILNYVNRYEKYVTTFYKSIPDVEIMTKTLKNNISVYDDYEHYDLIKQLNATLTLFINKLNEP
jgi:hypothetical protein